MIHIAARVLSVTGLARLIRNFIGRKKLFCLVMHDVIRQRRSDLNLASQYGLTVDELDAILTWIGKEFYFLSPQEFLGGVHHGVMLTFDDGKANNYTNILPL